MLFIAYIMPIHSDMEKNMGLKNFFVAGMCFAAACVTLFSCNPIDPVSAQPEAQDTLPSIILHPQSQTIMVGSRCVLSVRAVSTPKPTYQWRKNGTDINGAADSDYVIAAVTAADTGTYVVVVTNTSGSITSDPAIVEVGIAPYIGKTDSQMIMVGTRCTLSVAAIGSPAPTYQWLRNGTPLPGETGNRLIIDSFAVADSGLYLAIVTNRFGSIGGNPSRLDAGIPPHFTINPKTQTLNMGAACTLSVHVDGNPAPSLQWRFNDVALPGASDTTYTISSFTRANTGAYTVVAVNAFGSDTSTPGELLLSGIVLKSIAAGSYHSLMVKSNDSLYACGSNSAGQLGIGLTSEQQRIPVGIMPNVKYVSAGNNHTMILKYDGTLWACGANQMGQLGTGTTIAQTTPMLVMSDVQSVSAGNLFTLILTKDGTLWGCGFNANGQLGDGTTITQLTPVMIMNGVASISAGNMHSLIVKTDSTLWACGNNYGGKLGDGTTTNRATPVQIATGVARASAGGSFSLILKGDGTLWGCGRNLYGSLGTGTTEDVLAPVQIMAGVAAISAGGAHSLIVKMDRTLWSCGLNQSGQLGDGSTIQRLIPVKIMDNVLEVSAGSAHSLVLTTTSIIYAFGNNDYGCLGDGTQQYHYVPFPINF